MGEPSPPSFPPSLLLSLPPSLPLPSLPLSLLPFMFSLSAGTMILILTTPSTSSLLEGQCTCIINIHMYMYSAVLHHAPIIYVHLYNVMYLKYCINWYTYTAITIIDTSSLTRVLTFSSRLCLDSTTTSRPATPRSPWWRFSSSPHKQAALMLTH